MTGINFTTKLLNLNLILEKSQIKAGQSIADLGCGRSGHFAFLLARHVGSKGVVYAVDIIKQNLAIIEKEASLNHISNIKTIWSDIEIYGATQIMPESIDICFLINAIHQSKKPLESLRESIRITKKGGKLIIIDWSKISSPLGPDSSIRIDKDKLVDAAKKNGLYLESDFAAGPYHFGLVLIKA